MYLTIFTKLEREKKAKINVELVAYISPARKKTNFLHDKKTCQHIKSALYHSTMHNKNVTRDTQH